MPIASGGSACGLAVANYLTGSNLKYVISSNWKHNLEFAALYSFRIHSICVCDDAALFHKDINTILDKLGFSEHSEGRPDLRSRDIIDIIDGYKGHGNYGPSTDEELGIN